MKNLWKSVAFVTGFASLIGLSTQFYSLSQKDKEIENQKSRYETLHKKYCNLAREKNDIEFKNFRDSIFLSVWHKKEVTSLYNQYFDLVFENILLEDLYLSSLNKCLEKEKEKQEMQNEMIGLMEKSDFYFKTSNYLDSLLNDCMFSRTSYK